MRTVRRGLVGLLVAVAVISTSTGVAPGATAPGHVTLQLVPAVPTLGKTMSVGTQFGPALALPDGSTLVVGRAGTSDGQDYLEYSSVPLIVVKVLPDGTLDPSFGTNGVARPLPPDFQQHFQPDELLQQADGRLIVVGNAGFVGGDRAPLVELFRLNADGTRDTTFASGGVATGPDLQVSCGCASVAADGSILVTGQSGHYGFKPGDTSRPQWVVARFTPDGALDGSYGNNGLVMMPAPDSNGTDVKPLPDGSALVGGRSGDSAFDSVSMVARLTPSGALDPAFNGGTIVRPALGAGPLHVEPDGSFEVFGRAGLARYTATGQLDDAYGDHGVAHDFLAFSGSPQIHPAANGGLLLAGLSTSTNIYHLGYLRLVRLTADGKADLGLGGRGQEIDLGASFSLKSLVQRADGSVLATGFANVAIGFAEGESTAVYQGALAATDASLTRLDPAFGGPGGMTLTARHPRHALTNAAVKVRVTASDIGTLLAKAVVGRKVIARAGSSARETLLTAPQTRTLLLDLTPAGRRLIARHRPLHVVTTVTGRDLADNVTTARTAGTFTAPAHAAEKLVLTYADIEKFQNLATYIDAVVRNDGDRTSRPAVVHVYLSRDTRLSADDTRLPLTLHINALKPAEYTAALGNWQPLLNVRRRNVLACVHSPGRRLSCRVATPRKRP
jgi:uncharacterized delta-60 repeat protein